MKKGISYKELIGVYKRNLRKAKEENKSLKSLIHKCCTCENYDLEESRCKVFDGKVLTNIQGVKCKNYKKWGEWKSVDVDRNACQNCKYWKEFKNEKGKGICSVLGTNLMYKKFDNNCKDFERKVGV